MQSKFTKLEKNLGNLELIFTPDEFKQVIPKAFNRCKGQFRINGFRKGKAPLNIVLQAYGEQVLYEDIINLLIEENMDKALKENNLEIVARPELEVKAIGSKEDTVLVLKLTLTPDVELAKYYGVEAIKPETNVSDEQVQSQLQRVRERSARTVSVEDRPVKEGDIVTIDYLGKVNDVEFEGGKAEKYDLEIGSNSFIPGFEDQIIGHQINETFDVNVTFPEQYHAENLAGQAAVFTVTIHAIKEKELPVLDDEFAKDVSEFDTLEEYKEDLRKKMAEEAETRAKREFENNVLKAVVDNAKVDLPEAMVEQEMTDLVNQQARQFAMQGIKLEDLLQYSGSDIETYRESMRESAQIHVKTELVLKAIIKKENISLTDAEKEAELEKLAKRYNMDVAEIKRQFGDNLDQILIGSLLTKTIKILCDKAIAIAPTEEIKL